MNRAPLSHVLLLAFLIAVWVCLDPVVSAMLGLDWFPYELSAGLALVCVGGMLILHGMDAVWRHKDLWVLGGTVFAAQFSGVALGKLDGLEFAILALVLYWLVVSFVEVDRTVQVSPLFFPVLVILFLAILHFIRRPPVTSYLAIGEKILMLFIVIDLLRTPAAIKVVSRCVVWIGVFSAVVALVQFVLFYFWGVIWTIGASEEKAHAMMKPTIIGMVVRAMAFFPNPAGLNTYLLFACGLAITLFFYSTGFRDRAAYLLAITVMSMAVVLTWSAGALICLGAMFVLVLYVYWPSHSIHITALFVLAGIVIYELDLHKVILEIVKGFGGKTSGSIRIELLELAMASMDRDPFIGMGLQNFGRFSGNLFPTGPWLFKYPVHNAFMQMATELGIVGGLTYLFIIGFLSIRLVMVLRGPLEGELKYLFKGMLLGWCGLMGHLMTEPMAYEGTLWLILGIMEGSFLTVFRERHVQARHWNGAGVLRTALP